MALKKEVAPQPYRMLLKVLKFAISRTLFVGGDAGIHGLNTREIHFHAVDAETDLLRQLIFLIGYEVIDNEQLILPDFHSSQPQLKAFCELASEEISSMPCPGIEQLKQIDNTSLLVAQLSYNFRIRIELMVLLTPTLMMEIAEEDVLNGLECVDYITDRLGLMKPNMDLKSVWAFTKEQIQQYVISHGARGSTAEIRSTMMGIGTRLGLELNSRFGSSVAQIFLYTYSVSVIMAASGSVYSWKSGMAEAYLQTCSSLPSGYFSQRYLESIDRLRPLLLLSRERNLNESECQSVRAITVWQSGNFIYHVCLDSSAGQEHATSSRVQPALGVHGRHANQTGKVRLPYLVFINKTSPSESVHGTSKMENKALVGTERDHVTTDDHSLKCTNELTMASASSSDPKCLPFVEDSGLIQDDLSSLSLVETLRQQLHHSKSSDAVHLEGDVDRLIQDAREKHKQVSQDITELLDAISTISDPIVISPLQEEAEEKKRQLEEEESVLQSLTQLKDEMRQQLVQRSQQGDSVLSRFVSLLGPDVIMSQLKMIMDSVCGDQEKLLLLMNCAVDVIPVEVLECLRNELDSIDYNHPDNRHYQEILVRVLSRKLSFM
jgi:hypothetical protein